MRKINYKSDFDAVLRLRDCEDPDKFVPWPDCDFEVAFWTSGKARCHTASRKGATYTNCFATGDGGMHFVFKGQRMGMGTLKWEPHFALPNGIYPDGIQDIYRKADLGITLVDGEGDCPTTADVEVLVPYIKFKYEDLTDAEKADLGKPATDAAASVAELERSVETAEAGRVEGEKSRVAAETTRQTDEATRQGNEAKREEAEADREENEDRRVSAESKRAEEFAAWQGEIDSKADKSELSNIIAEEPLTPDNFPDINTYTREELKMDLFIDMWNQAWYVNGTVYGKYDPVNAPDAEHPFMGNDIWMTYEEAIEIYALYPLCKVIFTSRQGQFAKLNVRTLPPINTDSFSATNYIETFLGNPNLVAVKFITAYNYPIVNISGPQNMFKGCRSLKHIDGTLSFSPNINISGVFESCSSLEEVSIKNLRQSLSIASSPNLSLESLAFMAQNAVNTSPITVTVHTDVYTKLTDEANAEWHQVLIDAAAKNITFATT